MTKFIFLYKYLYNFVCNDEVNLMVVFSFSVYMNNFIIWAHISPRPLYSSLNAIGWFQPTSFFNVNPQTVEINIANQSKTTVINITFMNYLNQIK